MGMRQIRNVTIAAGLAVLGTVMMAMPASAAPALSAPAATRAPVGTITSSISGTFTDATGAVGTVTGTFVPRRFRVVNRHLVAAGVVTATLTDAAGKAIGTASKAVTLPLISGTAAVAGQTGQVSAQAISCQVLDLVLGPLDLNLLGLVVHLNQVHLNITAVPGAGALLGNLLCAVANLLNGGLGGLLGQVAALLNQILAILGL